MPKPWIFFDACEYLASEGVSTLTLEEEALQMRQIASAVERSDHTFLQQFRFVKRYGVTSESQRSSIPTQVRNRVLAVGRCARCGSTESLEVDHILPVFHGGSSDESNLQPLCRSCNRRKGRKMEGIH